MMNLILSNKTFNLNLLNTFIKKIFFLNHKKNFNKLYYIKNTNLVHTFFKNGNYDLIAINNKNIVIFYYENIPKNKLIEIKNDKKNTNIIVLPNNISKHIKIGDILNIS